MATVWAALMAEALVMFAAALWAIKRVNRSSENAPGQVAEQVNVLTEKVA
ncbi:MULTISPECIES: hypothetical protein [Pseudonocardiaceae]|nr:MULTISPECIES: hypothetical protein [Pseudonocardiaceae]